MLSVFYDNAQSVQPCHLPGTTHWTGIQLYTSDGKWTPDTDKGLLVTFTLHGQDFKYTSTSSDDIYQMCCSHTVGLISGTCIERLSSHPPSCDENEPSLSCEIILRDYQDFYKVVKDDVTIIGTYGEDPTSSMNNFLMMHVARRNEF